MVKNIEVEVRALLSDAEYRRVKAFLRKHAKYLGSHRDQNTYFDREGRLRISVEPHGAFLKYKSGRIHAKAREELFVPIRRRDIKKAEVLFERLGFPVVVRWSRYREKFSWRGTTLTLDNTRGYGRMIDIEMMATPKTTAKTYRKLQDLMAALGIKPTPAAKIKRHYRWYLRSWRKFFTKYE